MQFPISFGWIFMAVCAVIVFLCYFIFGVEHKKNGKRQELASHDPAYPDTEPADDPFEHTMIAAPSYLKESKEMPQNFRKQPDLVAAIVRNEEDMAANPTAGQDMNPESQGHRPMEYTIVAGSIEDGKVQAEATGLTGSMDGMLVAEEPEGGQLSGETVVLPKEPLPDDQKEEAAPAHGEVLGSLPIWEHKEADLGGSAGGNTATVHENADRKNQPIPFGSKICWLAIKTDSADQVIEALNLQDIQTANWEKGLSAAYKNDGEIFVTPVLGEWVLAIGRSILEKIGIYDMENSFFWLLYLSEQLGSVQYFCTQSSADYHAWAWAENGTLVRAYAYSGKAGECLWDLGDPKEDEEALMLGKRALNSEDGRFVPDEAFVIALANAWSVDPSFKRGIAQSALGVSGFLD